MRIRDEQIANLPKTWIRSKVKFAGIYEEEIKKAVEELWEFLDKELEKIYSVEYVDIGNKNIKIKIEDEDKFIFRIVNCVFDYTSADEKFGNARIELTFNEISQKPRFHLVGKFALTDWENLKKMTLKAIIKWLEEIYE